MNTETKHVINEMMTIITMVFECCFMRTLPMYLYTENMPYTEAPDSRNPQRRTTLLRLALPLNATLKRYIHCRLPIRMSLVISS